MKVNKTLLKIILVILVIIILMIPIFIFVHQDNKNKKYNQLLEEITTATEKFVSRNNVNVDSENLKIKLSELKEVALLSNNLQNPKTGNPLSNESYVIISNHSGKNTYDIKLYDIPDKETNADLLISLNGSKKYQLGISVRYEEQGANFFEGTTSLEYSVQYFLRGKEVNTIDSSLPKTFEVAYTALNSKGELAKIVRSVVIQ